VSIATPQHEQASLPPLAPWRQRLHEIIFEADTRAGKAFDLLLLLLILISVVAVMLESVEHIGARYTPQLLTIEWVITILFTAEYALRLLCVRRPLRYARSFFGIIDLLAILPTYLALLIPGAQSLMVIRLLRLLRIFRILKLARYVSEGQILVHALRAARPKIVVFLIFVASMVSTMGALMYLIEGPQRGFTSIPQSVYWAVVTLTTVGYGDIIPSTPVGKAIASFIMITGYAVIAVPTGIVTTEIAIASRHPLGVSTQACPSCSAEGHNIDAKFCRRCGAEL
jgi:voltage-gated potassium channel